jgi:hypothetical protein
MFRLLPTDILTLRVGSPPVNLCLTSGCSWRLGAISLVGEQLIRLRAYTGLVPAGASRQITYSTCYYTSLELYYFCSRNKIHKLTVNAHSC